MRQQRAPRRGASLVEFALVAPVTFFLMIGLLVGGMGIFRYQEVATLAREAARYASVHGTGYASDTGNPAAAPDDGNFSGGTGQCSLVYNNAIAANNVSLDLSQLQYSVTWNTSNRPYHSKIVNGSVIPVTNTVRVTITYQWMPEALLGGITMTSTAETSMCN
jgi:Flp pilus assembly protein TadG